MVGGAFTIGSCIYTGTYFLIKSGEAWSLAEKSIVSSSQVSDKYGKIKTAGMSFFGFSYSLRGGEEKVSLKSSVDGELATGDVYVRIHRREGDNWAIDSIVVPN